VPTQRVETALTNRATLSSSNRPGGTASFGRRLADLTPDERAQLAKLFHDLFRPAAERWSAAYEGRIPFALDEFTLDKFHGRLGSHMYTFMIGDTTFTMLQAQESARVSYLMTSKAAAEMNSLPGQGFVPNLKPPVSREEVIRMVKADSGVEYKPNEVLIRPTAAACALNGGAFVRILPTGADPEDGLSSVIDLVFDAEGRVVNYERSPLF
jgi:hypothetical protein